MAEEDEEEPSFGKGCRKGGARHFSKPFVDNGLVYSVFVDNKDLLQDLKNYECTSKNNSPDAKGLVQTLPLWKGLLRLESSGEIHSQPLRTALIKLLSEYPEMNRSAQSGQVWANLRLERITTILYHVRKVGRDAGKDGLYACAAKLTRQQYEHLQGGLKLLEGSVAKEKALEKANPPQEEKALEKAESSHAKLPVKTDSKRKLKQEDSEVSMDNNGFPKMFGSPESTEKAEAMPVAAMAMDRTSLEIKLNLWKRVNYTRLWGLAHRHRRRSLLLLWKKLRRLVLWERHRSRGLLVLWKRCSTKGNFG